MDKWASPVAEISLERGKFLLTGMEVSPYKHESSKILHAASYF
jgi:hypothetical protein